LVDCSADATVPPHEAVAVIRAELRGYSAELASRPTLLVATKVEDDAACAAARELSAALGEPVLAISAATRTGLVELLAAVAARLWPAPPACPRAPPRRPRSRVGTAVAFTLARAAVDTGRGRERRAT